MQLHINYLEALYRALHDVSETPRTAFGDGNGVVAGVALEIQLQPLSQKVARKRIIRAPVYRRRNEMILRLIDLFTGTEYGTPVTRTVWSPVTPRDVSRQVEDARAKVAAGLGSRQGEMSTLGVVDPAAEWERW